MPMWIYTAITNEAAKPRPLRAGMEATNSPAPAPGFICLYLVINWLYRSINKKQAAIEQIFRRVEQWRVSGRNRSTGTT